MPLLVAVLSFAWGYAKLGTIETGKPSEMLSGIEAAQMLAGEQSYGLVEYTHYPNGPTYLLALKWTVGLRGNSARLVPLAAAALSLGFLLWAMLTSPTTDGLRAFAVVACVALLFQPGFALWQGALHEHSYALSLAFAALACATVLSPRHGWVFFVFGFVAGWVGYDFIPVQAGAVVTGRWLFHAQGRSGVGSLGSSFALAALDGLRFASGVTTAVLAHVLQLALYFTSVEEATRDLLGSAAGRMGASSAATINPEYHEFLSGNAGWGIDERTEKSFATFLVERFFMEFAHFGVIASVVGLGIVTAIVDLLRRGARPAGVALPVVLGVGLGSIGVSSIAWLYLMPRHAVFHMHMLPRHLFVTWAMLVVLTTAVAWPARPTEGTSGPSPRASSLAFALYGIPIAALLALVGYTVVVLA